MTNHMLWYFFLFLVLHNIVSFLFINKQCQINFVFYFCKFTILVGKCYDNFTKLTSIINTRLLVKHFADRHKILLGVKAYNTWDFCWYWLSIKLNWSKTTSTTLRLGTFSKFYILSINFFALLNNFIISAVCNSILYPSFVLKTNLLLILINVNKIPGGLIANAILKKFENTINNPCLISSLDVRSFSRWCTFLKMFEIPA